MRADHADGQNSRQLVRKRAFGCASNTPSMKDLGNDAFPIAPIAFGLV